MSAIVPKQIQDFLLCSTPSSWLQYSVEHLDQLLIDHANCEKKAASTALSLMFKYDCHAELCYRMSRLAREELRHYEQVLKIMQTRGIEIRPVKPARYAGFMHKSIATYEPRRLSETLIIGGIIEARSCERFAALIPYLEENDESELAKFYSGLLASEARHFEHYLKLAKRYWMDKHSSNDIINEQFNQRVQEFLEIEKDLISTEDKDFNFHSGVPISFAALAN